jgi:hypothetical protein
MRVGKSQTLLLIFTSSVRTNDCQMRVHEMSSASAISIVFSFMGFTWNKTQFNLYKRRLYIFYEA